MIRRLILLLAASAALYFDAEAQPARNLFRGARVAALDARRNYEAEKAVDGQHFRSSTWMPANDSRPPYLLEVSLDRYCDIDSMVIYTGIPEGERTQSESMQSAGYWNMKNFIIQYWDDANWTDIGETLTTENRLDKVVFRFRPAVTSFRFRIRSTDGEPIRIIEFEGYGRPNPSMPSPSTVTEEVVRKEYPSEVGATVRPEPAGRTMRYVGYNQGYFMPGSNVSAWLEYSGVNAVRLWMPLDFLVPETAVDAASCPESLEAFETLKESLRRNPQESAIDWDTIARRADSVYVSTNTMVYNYALDELRRLGIESLIQTSAYKATPDWPKRWLLWQRMYALAYYSALRGGVEMFAMQNEPNHRHAGPIPLDEWIRMMRIASDAVHCGVEDATKAGAGDLQGKFVGPVTAGTNTNWWAAIAAAEGTDYRGKACERDLIDLFSTHSYNLPATGYEGKTPTIDRILRENHPQSRTKPILYTEIGRWMNAYLIDKEETMDSPTLFTEWAGIYARNMVEG
ncbi:MAG: carbohydrate-binding protein, partial [Alistipes sp.]|nr:carbohydrate-binding protein [Alistipes sp.]